MRFFFPLITFHDVFIFINVKSPGNIKLNILIVLESREKRSANPFIVQVISNNVITVARVRPSKILEMIHAPSLELSYYERLARACQRSCFQESLPTRTMCVTVLHYFTRAECARCLHRSRRNHLVTPRVGTRRYVDLRIQHIAFRVVVDHRQFFFTR